MENSTKVALGAGIGALGEISKCKEKGLQNE